MEQLTQHAAARMQQRGIKQQTIECLMKFGTKTHDNHGAVVFYFDKQARRRMKDRLDQKMLNRMESQMDAYAVLSVHGDIVTVGHRTRRIGRH